MRWGHVASSFIFGLASLVVAEPAHAQDQGRLQLSLQSTLLRYASTKTTIEDSNIPPVTRSLIQSGIGSDPGLGVGIGYLWTDVLLGARTSVTTYRNSSSPVGGTESTGRGTSISLAPRVEVLLTRGNVRPFVAGLLGYRHGWGSGESNYAIGTDTLHTSSRWSSNGFTAGAGAGVHAFLTRWLSIDPELTFLASTAKSENHSSSPNYDASGFIGNIEQTQRTTDRDLSLLLTVSLSGWLGGH